MGNAGNDMLTGGADMDSVSGGGGDDTLFIFAGDLMSGETYDGQFGSSDKLRIDDTGTFDFSGVTIADIELLSLKGSAGTDRILMTSAQVNAFGQILVDAGFTWELELNDAAGATLDIGFFDGGFASGITIVRGTDFGDQITADFTDAREIYGEGGNDTLVGADQSDTLDGGEGADSITGEFGSDSLFGGDGDDTLEGDDDNDTLNGGLGNDSLDGGSGLDSLLGGDGDDTLRGDDNDDTLDGGAGDDDLNDGYGNDFMLGGDGNDDLFGGQGNDTLQGGNDNDTLDGDSGADSLVGGAGNDLLDGGSSDDVMEGGAGDDTLVHNFQFDNDTIDGGTGLDTLLLENTINLATISDYADIEKIDLNGNAPNFSNALISADSIGLLNPAGGDALFPGGPTEDALIIDGINDQQSPDKLTLNDPIGWAFTGGQQDIGGDTYDVLTHTSGATLYVDPDVVVLDSQGGELGLPST